MPFWILLYILIGRIRSKIEAVMAKMVVSGATCSTQILQHTQLLYQICHTNQRVKSSWVSAIFELSSRHTAFWSFLRDLYPCQWPSHDSPLLQGLPVLQYTYDLFDSKCWIGLTQVFRATPSICYL